MGFSQRHLLETFLKIAFSLATSDGLPEDKHLTGPALGGASLPHPPGLLPGGPFNRSRDHSCRNPWARAFPARLLTGRHFPLLKGENNFPNVILKSPVRFISLSAAAERAQERRPSTVLLAPGAPGVSLGI